MYEQKEIEPVNKFRPELITIFETKESYFFSHKNKLVPKLPTGKKDLNDLPEDYKQFVEYFEVTWQNEKNNFYKKDWNLWARYSFKKTTNAKQVKDAKIVLLKAQYKNNVRFPKTFFPNSCFSRNFFYINLNKFFKGLY